MGEVDIDPTLALPNMLRRCGWLNHEHLGLSDERTIVDDQIGNPVDAPTRTHRKPGPSLETTVGRPQLLSRVDAIERGLVTSSHRHWQVPALPAERLAMEGAPLLVPYPTGRDEPVLLRAPVDLLVLLERAVQAHVEAWPQHAQDERVVDLRRWFRWLLVQRVDAGVRNLPRNGVDLVGPRQPLVERSLPANRRVLVGHDCVTIRLTRAQLGKPLPREHEDVSAMASKPAGV